MKIKLISFFLLLICTIYYSVYVEPTSIRTKHLTFSDNRLNSNTTIKLIQISDTHFKHKKDIERFKKVVNNINQMKPDFILFTGDLVSDIRKFSYKHEVIQLLKELSPKIGKLAIYGNHDHGGYFTEQYEELLSESNFILLKNEEITYYVQNQKVSFIGLDDYMLGNKQYNEILERIQKNSYTVVLAHEPDIADLTKNYPINLQLSGHSHGGQIYLPLYKSFIMPPYAKKYNRGVYTLSSKYNSHLVVSNGIGTTKLPIRLFTPPEIVSIEISGQITPHNSHPY
ncbi:metallophosphoesterase [Gottfriedia acidiceleris]|uniref:Metallophosphoesterase n=1 Tax=Gottfriedia acidiceleris TaxID=371036 RepID=A0ABY4JK84_9BACI|nr:metallophosphoesterase [Gottfriedia acidiceleris]UPM53228.1 metallophosphoesterase [Gottfriedia acidiceleris]